MIPTGFFFSILSVISTYVLDEYISHIWMEKAKESTVYSGKSHALKCMFW